MRRIDRKAGDVDKSSLRISHKIVLDLYIHTSYKIKMMTFGRLDFSCNPKTQKLTTPNTESLVILITLYETYNPKIQHLSLKVDDVEGGASFGNRPANTTLRLLPFYLCC